jgi:hypothetical protein
MMESARTSSYRSPVFAYLARYKCWCWCCRVVSAARKLSDMRHNCPSAHGCCHSRDTRSYLHENGVLDLPLFLFCSMLCFCCIRTLRIPVASGILLSDRESLGTIGFGGAGAVGPTPKNNYRPTRECREMPLDGRAHLATLADMHHVVAYQIRPKSSRSKSQGREDVHFKDIKGTRLLAGPVFDPEHFESCQ